MKIPDIHKAGGILIKDRKLLVEKSFTKELFYAPGGKLEIGETSPQALVRELKEEFNIDILESDIEFFGTFYDKVHNTDKTIQMDVYLVKDWQGQPSPNREVEKILWIDSQTEGVSVGTIFGQQVMPKLKDQNLID